MMLISRPFSVFLCLLPFRRMSLKAKTYVSWVGLRGAVPIIFATYPLIAEIPNATLIFNVVFFITILSLTLQGSTVSGFAKWLGLSIPEPQEKTFKVELPEDIKTALSEIEVESSMLQKGNRLMDLTLPDNTLVVLIKRQQTYRVPTGKTKLAEGDKLLVISDNEEELIKTYENLGVQNYYIDKNN